MEALLDSGVILATVGDFDGADAAFTFCSRVDPNHPALRNNRLEVTLHRAEAARDAKKDIEAAALLGQAIAAGADDAVLRAWGLFFFESEEYERAIPYLDRLAARHPDDAEGWHKLGTSFQKVGNLEASSLDFAKAHHLFALEFLRAGELEAAARSSKQYHHWSLPDDAGPFVLDAAIAFAGEIRARPRRRSRRRKRRRRRSIGANQNAKNTPSSSPTRRWARGCESW